MEPRVTWPELMAVTYWDNVALLVRLT